MFCANVLFQDISFDFNFSLTRNMALTNNIPSGIKKEGLFSTFIAYTKSIRDFFKNLGPSDRTM
jgi:hypothetical protein